MFLNIFPTTTVISSFGMPPQIDFALFNGYVYPHDFPNDWVEQQYLPNDIKNAKYYTFGENKTEQSAKAYWENVKKKKL